MSSGNQSPCIPFKLNGEDETHYQEHSAIHLLNWEMKATQLVFADSHGLDIECKIFSFAGSVHHIELIVKADHSGEVIAKGKCDFVLALQSKLIAKPEHAPLCVGG
jgi:hypothetical protein